MKRNMLDILINNGSVRIVVLFTLLLLTASALSGQSISSVPDDIYWDEGFGQPAFARSGNTVNDIIEFQNQIIFAGNYYEPVGGLYAQNIIAWTGTVFNTLDTGVSFEITGMAVFENKLLVHGQSDMAIWDGLHWASVDVSLFKNIYDIEVAQGQLYAAGMNSTNTHILAYWNGSGWVNSTHSFNGQIRDLQAKDSILLVAGSFNEINGEQHLHIAEYDGTAWLDNMTGTGYEIQKVATDGTVVAALSYNTSQSVVMQLNDTLLWNQLPYKYYGKDIADICIYDNKVTVLYALSISDSLNSIVAWSGNSWDGVGDDIYGQSQLLSSNGRLVIGGQILKRPETVYVRFAAELIGDTWQILTEKGADIGIGSIFEMLPLGDSTILIGGDLTSVGETDLFGLGTFDGEDWQYIGSGNVMNLISIENLNSMIYIGGFFDELAGSSCSSLVSFDGFNWQDEELPAMCQVNDIEYFNDHIIVATDLTNGQVPQESSLWIQNGNSWLPLHDSANKPISSMAVYDGKLFVSGKFDSLAGRPFDHIATWDGTVWSELPEIPVEPYDIYAIGELTPIGDSIIMYISLHQNLADFRVDALIWDGTDWSFLVGPPHLDGQSNKFLAFSEFNGNLVVGGMFDSLGGVEVNNIASWDGYTFSPLGSGIRDDTTSLNMRGTFVTELAEFRDDLYVGGFFDFAGDKRARGFARWTKGIPTEVIDNVEPDLLPQTFTLHQNYPNPFNPTTDISFELPRISKVSLEVFNILGQKVADLLSAELHAGEHTVSWDAQGVAGGIYLYRLQVGELALSKKMVLLK